MRGPLSPVAVMATLRLAHVWFNSGQATELIQFQQYRGQRHSRQRLLGQNRQVGMENIALWATWREPLALRIHYLLIDSDRSYYSHTADPSAEGGQCFESNFDVLRGKLTFPARKL